MILRDATALRACVTGWRKTGATIGLVPTMGALHEGHLSLVRAAQSECDRVIVSIFVNPTQFNNPQDLATYPRTEEADIALLQGVDALFIPDVGTIYPPGFCSSVQVGGLADRLEGAHRPGHFSGMATIVTKLFGLTGTDRAYFGEKDWQQLQIIRRFTQDLNLPVTIRACPTLREADGLALSSRNRRLSAQARAQAPLLHALMSDTAHAIRQGQPVAKALAKGEAGLKAAGFGPIDYLACCDAQSLDPIEVPAPGQVMRLLVAVALDSVRLIDNIVI